MRLPLTFYFYMTAVILQEKKGLFFLDDSYCQNTLVTNFFQYTVLLSAEGT